MEKFCVQKVKYLHNRYPEHNTTLSREGLVITGRFWSHLYNDYGVIVTYKNSGKEYEGRVKKDDNENIYFTFDHPNIGYKKRIYDDS
ncbi:MAG: hypothetical protein UU61_C0003G0007 [Parcubacteria group bacterium GW2011_GWB1_41_4]|nr:MAG: hypothetical protein UU61_C0003G0007 [Parcubacteria group bacterium GW2011_GWB1_41_4]